MFTASRLSGNCIGGYYDDDDEFVANTEGIIALCEGLKGSSVTSLECAAATSSRVFAFVSAPADKHMCPLTVPPPVPRSIARNYIEDEGASALAAILKETQITKLKCATTRQCSLSCQRPLTRSIAYTHSPLARTVSTGTTSESRAPPRSPRS